MRPGNLALALAASGVHANLISTSVVSWQWQSSIAVGNYLYVTGGEQYKSEFQESDNTYVVDLTVAWNNQTLQPVTTSAPPNGMNGSRQPLVFYDQTRDRVKRYGGWKYNDDSTNTSTLWSLDPKQATGDWTKDGDIEPNGASPTGPFAAAVAFSNTTFYSLGGNIGQSGGVHNMTVLSGLAVLDLASNTWTNVSQVMGDLPQYRTQARAVFVPNFGDKGTLVVVGGENPPTASSAYEEGISMVDMTSITIYDVASGEWYQQTATVEGAKPPPRSEFCAVGAPSADGSSFEIFVYGGSVTPTVDDGNGDDQGYLNVFVLSLPAFRWFKSNSTTPIRRAGHTCSIIGKRQMISIGGSFPSAGSEQWTSGIGVFDMTDFAWKDGYKPGLEAYVPPDVVRQYYNSSYQKPVWANSSLASIFKYTAKSSDSNSTASSGSGSSSSTPVGAIAGGAVGGAVLLAALFGLAFFWRRRRRPDSESSHELTGTDIKESDPKWTAAPQYHDSHEVSGAERAAQELPATSTVIPELAGDEAHQPGDFEADRKTPTM